MSKVCNEPCPTCGNEGYIKPLDEKNKYRCGYCGEILTHSESKPQSKPKSTAKNKMKTPNDPADKE